MSAPGRALCRTVHCRQHQAAMSSHGVIPVSPMPLQPLAELLLQPAWASAEASRHSSVSDKPLSATCNRTCSRFSARSMARPTPATSNKMVTQKSTRMRYAAAERPGPPAARPLPPLASTADAHAFTAAQAAQSTSSAARTGPFHSCAGAKGRNQSACTARVKVPSPIATAFPTIARNV